MPDKITTKAEIRTAILSALRAQRDKTLKKKAVPTAAKGRLKGKQVSDGDVLAALGELLSEGKVIEERGSILLKAG